MMGYGKRGKALENLIEYTNNVYKNQGVALVDKVPTPWNVSYDKKSKKVIRAFPEKKSTVDFVGLSHGRGIAFDAKNARETTRFPLKNIEEHQVRYLINHQDQGGISFFIICFEKKNEHYFLTIDQLVQWWNEAIEGGRKSIPYEWFVLNCYQIKSEKNVPLHYLKYCNTAYKQPRKEVLK